MKKKSNVKIVSPYEVQHYLFSFPGIRKRSEETAVRMAVKSMYPGNTDVCTDYISGKNSAVAFAVSKDKLSEYLKSDSVIFAAPQLIQKKVPTGTVLCIFEDCILVQVTNDRNIVFLKTYNRNENILDAVKEELSGKKIDLGEIRIFSAAEHVWPEIQEYASDNGVLIEPMEKLLSKKSRKIPSLFSVNRTSSYAGIIFFIFTCALLTACILTFIYRKHRMQSLENVFVNNSRILEKLQKQKIKVSETDEDYNTKEKLIFGAGCVLSELQKIDNTMVLDSFRLRENSFTAEGRCGSAAVLMKSIKSSVLFDSVVLKNVRPGESGDNFVLEAKIAE
ncbi:hypothetical protein DYE49_06475 [Treponema rectale]|uniref:Uncharacterized protein n=1 Tax=Treponema rectale TaxID=744512 RepID=A0A840SBL2_9SPIR|nr:hypothetical protein [Treponema rectale]MBB5218175.1 hypothetical protein [Treponema rectale]QOS40120.1 hypothetical protein DYE49_06475 [Treponema rectale]